LIDYVEICIGNTTKMKELPWFERNMVFGKPKEMLPYFLERLDGTIVRLQSKVKGVSDKVLSGQANGKWSVKQNIGHLADVDEIGSKRIQEIISGISPMSPAVVEPKLDYSNMPIDEVINRFAKFRNENILRFQNLPDVDLAKTSLHPRFKVLMTPVDLAWFKAEHDDHHLVKINFILNKLS